MKITEARRAWRGTPARASKGHPLQSGKEERKKRYENDDVFLFHFFRTKPGKVFGKESSDGSTLREGYEGL
jgi:hypothetical protein